MVQGPVAGSRGQGYRGRTRGPWAKRRSTVYGAIDLGSNNCRLLVAIPQHDGFRVIDAFSRIVRLGEGLETSGRLSEEAMARTVEALRVCASKMRRRHVSRARSIATAACRGAANCSEFVVRVKQETGLSLDIITPAEEARLAAASCEPLMNRAIPNALVFDIGGGSTELIWARWDGDGEAVGEAWISLPRGVISLAEKFGGIEVAPDVYEEMVAEIVALVEPFAEEHGLREMVGAGEMQFLGTSGTVTTLAGLHLGLARYDRQRVDGLTLSAGDFRAVAARLAAMSYDQRKASPCIGAERADMVIAGCAILEAIRRVLPFESLRVADRGLREGVLLGLMRTDGRVRGPS